jgi:tetratricopeptide (TPR) repeat protein
MVALFGISFIATVEENEPFIMMPIILAFIDAILFFAMPKEDFDEKYNARKMIDQNRSQQPRRQFDSKYRKAGRRHQNVRYNNPHKVSGLEKYKDYDYEGAIQDFKKALNVKYDDPAIHFNLACAYSIMESTENSFFHLDKAVEYGFEDFERIQTHDALAYVRTTDEYDQFAENGFRKVAQIEAPKEDLLSTPTPLMDSDILEKIASLGELRDKGFLTDEEFNLQKKRLLEMR